MQVYFPSESKYKHERLGMSYLGQDEEELYRTLTTRNTGRSWVGQLNRIGQGEPVTAATVGTQFHEYMENLKMMTGEAEAVEQMVESKQLGLAGPADVVYKDNTISDIKSVTQGTWQKIQNRGAPLQKHFDQVNAYASVNGSRKGQLEYHLISDPSQRVTYEWETDETNFRNTMRKVTSVRNRINFELAAGRLREEDLPTRHRTSIKESLSMIGNSHNANAVHDSLEGFKVKREQYYQDKKNSNFERLENFNINKMMDGNKSEYVFKGFHRAGQRHANMGY